MWFVEKMRGVPSGSRPFSVPAPDDAAPVHVEEGLALVNALVPHADVIKEHPLRFLSSGHWLTCS